MFTKTSKVKKKKVCCNICFYQALKIKQSILFTHERFYSESVYIWHSSYFSLIKNKNYNECLPFNCSILVSFCPQFRNMFSKNDVPIKVYSACPIPMPSLSFPCFPREWLKTVKKSMLLLFWSYQYANGYQWRGEARITQAEWLWPALELELN